MESILTSIKKLLGITEDYTQFDQDIIMHINSVFSILNQLGVGPPEGFSISDNFAVWNNFILDNYKQNLVKTYVYLRVRLMFDPNQPSAVIESIKNQISELEWRIKVNAETESDISDIY